ncbi:MAG: TSUP family transporter [Bacteriovoracales bacterium]
MTNLKEKSQKIILCFRKEVGAKIKAMLPAESLFPVVFLYATIQSVFGVGLLLFGTPTLLFMGYSFEQALALLLPCSMTVNALQLATHWKDASLKRDFVLFCLPLVALGMWVAISNALGLDLKLIVGLLLVLTASLRVFARLQTGLKAFFKRFARPSLVLIGAIHGLSNMGGGLLTIFAASTYQEKHKLRVNVAFGYLLMATCQLAVLSWKYPELFSVNQLVLMLAAALTYLAIGNRVFAMASNTIYQHALTGFILIFGLFLLV